MVEHGGRGEQSLEHGEGSLCLRGLYERSGGGGELGEECRYLAFIPEKAVLKVGKP